MKKIIKILYLSSLLLTIVASPLYAQKESGKVFRGNKEYEKQDYTAAEVEYRRGIEANKESFEAPYNLGNALFRQEKYPEAQAEFEKAASLLPKEDKANRAATFHNIGNAFFAQEQYEKAIEAYKEALRNNPKDDDTRYNLVKAMEMLKKQQEQQQQQQQNQQQNQKDQQQQQKEQQQQEKQNQQNQNQQEQQQNQQQEQQQAEAQEQDQKMDKETAEQILQALEQDEQETQEKLQRQQGTKRRVEKDW